MSKIVEDLSTITTIPEFTLKKILDRAKMIICHNALESMLSDGNEVKVDIGIGSLSLQITENSLCYRFVPSPSFDEMLKQTIISKSSPLSELLEESLTVKIESVYKELC